MSKTKISSPIKILSQSFSILKKNFNLLAQISAVSAILGVFSILINSSSKHSLSFEELHPLLTGVLGILFFLIQIWAAAALIYAVTKGSSKELDFKKAFSKAWLLFSSYLIATILTGLAVTGGLILLIIPGLIFMTWFSFSTMIVIAEKKKAIEAMKKSKAYVKGKFWEVFGRLVFLIFAVIILALILNIIVSIFPIGHTAQEVILQILASILLAPLSVIYLFQIYKEIKD